MRAFISTEMQVLSDVIYVATTVHNILMMPKMYL